MSARGTKVATALALALLCGHAVPAAADAPAIVTKESTRKKEKRGEKDVPLARQELDVRPLAIVGGHVHPVTSPDVPGGVVLLRGGRIEAVHSSSRADDDWAGKGYDVLDARGRHVYPGLVAAGADGLGLNFDAWAVGEEGMARPLGDSFNAWHDDVELAASAGITTALVYRAPVVAKGPLAGRAALLKMSYGEPRGALLREAAAAFLSPRGLSPESLFRLRRQVEEVRKEPAQRGGKPDHAAELLRAVARRKAPLMVPAESAGDVAVALDLARSLDLRVILYLSTEAWALADQVAAADVGAVQHVRGSWFKPRSGRRGEIEGGWKYDSPAILHRAGVEVAVLPAAEGVSTGGIGGRDFVNFAMEAAFAQRGGLSAQHALESITIVPARLLGVDDRVGSLEPGKDADVLVADGDILDYRTFVRETVVNGRVAYRAEGNRWWSWCIERRDRALGSGASVPPRPGAVPASARPVAAGDDSPPPRSGH